MLHIIVNYICFESNVLSQLQTLITGWRIWTLCVNFHSKIWQHVSVCFHVDEIGYLRLAWMYMGIDVYAYVYLFCTSNTVVVYIQYVCPCLHDYTCTRACGCLLGV